MKRSELFNWNSQDLWKGLALTVIAAILTAVYQLLETTGIDWTWAEVKEIIVVSAMAGISYLLKNLFTNGENRFAAKQQSKRNEAKGEEA